MEGGERIRDQVARWRDDLLDLTGRNRLLRFRHTKTSSLEIDSPAAQAILDRLLTGRPHEWAIHISEDDAPAVEPLMASPSPDFVGIPAVDLAGGGPVLRTTKGAAKEVRAACAGLSRRAAGEFMDRGIWVLYLGVGMLRWSDPADSSAEAQDSPVLLVPVRLESTRGGAEWKVLPSEEEALVNPALWLKLESDLGIELPTLDPEEPLDVGALFSGVRQAIGVQADWLVQERVVLSTFSFHKEVMYRDLRDNFEQIVADPIVGALASDPSQLAVTASDFEFEPIDEASLDEVVPPEQATTILDADASQRQCIAAACEGRSFVMDGPPGTGKSQTIANMIAELITNGRTVLFVSEKAAALDVVHNRLAEVGLDEYVLELHSHKTTRAAVASALGASLLRRPKPNPALTLSELNEAKRRREDLTRYADALNEPIAALGGRSLHHLLGQIAELQHLPQAPVATRMPLDLDELAIIRELGQRLNSTWEVVERGEDFVWRGAGATDWNATVEQRVQSKLDLTAKALTGLGAMGETVAEDLLLDPPSGPSEVEDLVRLLAILRSRPRDVPHEWVSHVEPEKLAQAAERSGAQSRAWQDARTAGLAAAGSKWQSVAEPSADVLAGTLDDLWVTLPVEASAADLARLAAAANRVAEQAETTRLTAAELAGMHGLRAADITTNAAMAAIALCEIARSDAPPPAAWLSSPDGVVNARSAVDEIVPLLEKHTAAREAARIFEPSVLDLDLAALVKRFSEEYRGLKKLGGAYRADRSALASTAPGVKPKAAVAAIDDALAWQRGRDALEEAAQRGAAGLADAWFGPETDSALLRRRLALAEQAHRIGEGSIVDFARFAQSVSGNGRPDDLGELAARAGAALSRLRAETPKELERALGQPLETAAAVLRQAATALGDLATVTARVDLIRGASGTCKEALAAAQARNAAAAIEDAHREDDEAARVLGRWFALDIEPEQLAAAVAWTSELRESLNTPPSGAAARRLTSVTPPDASDLTAALDRWQSALEGLLVEFAVERRGEVASDLESHFVDAAHLLDRLRDTRGEIEIWLAHATAISALAAIGLDHAVRFCVEQHIPVGQVVDVLRRSALEAMADAMLALRKESLEALRSVDRDRLVREYAGLDRKVIGDAAHRVMAAANARRPNTVLGLATVIANEAQKKRKHMPVARLLAKTAPVAQAIKPCFMMSPLSVSQFLSPDMHFDAVIFDEASQVRPSDAVNALYRGSAMIVAGDQKQLPPTSFFEQSTNDADEWSEDSLAEFDSVLDLAKSAGVFRSLSLRWHYRSRHEHLIAFSNHRFYGGELVTFPSPTEQADDLGVQLIPVDGVYRRGTSRDNPTEARAVIDRVFVHAQRGARSIGVVAFSEAQASLIDELVRQDPRRQDPRYAELFASDRLD